MSNNIQKLIRLYASNGKIRFKKHALIRSIERNITINEIETVLYDCTVVSEYVDDKPLASYLVAGFTEENRPLHMVIAIDDKEEYIWIITVYEPDKNKWDESYTRRIES